MGEDTEKHGGENGGVDSDREVSETPTGDGGDELVEAVVGEEAVSEVEGKRDGETNNDCDGDDEVGRSRSVHVLGECSPGDGLRVEGLNLLTRPNVGTLNIEEDFSLGRDNGFHDDQLEDGSDDGTNALNSESGTRRKLGVLTHLQITSQTESLGARVVSVESEVQVGLRVSRYESSSEHLSELLDVGFLVKSEKE